MARLTTLTFTLILEPNNKWPTITTWENSFKQYLMKNKRISIKFQPGALKNSFILYVDNTGNFGPYSIWDLEKDLYSFAGQNGFQAELAPDNSGIPLDVEKQVSNRGRLIIRMAPLIDKYKTSSKPEVMYG